MEKFLLTVVARFKAFKKRVPSRTFAGKRPQRSSASKAKSSVLSQISGLENVLFNDFIDDEPDSEDVSEQRASASLPDSVPIESEEERDAREEDEMTALDGTILLFHIISARPSKQPRMVGSTLGVYSFGLIFVSVRTNKRHHLSGIMRQTQLRRWRMCLKTLSSRL